MSDDNAVNLDGEELKNCVTVLVMSSLLEAEKLFYINHEKYEEATEQEKRELIDHYVFSTEFDVVEKISTDDEELHEVLRDVQHDCISYMYTKHNL